MMQKSVKTLRKRLFRRGESGQSILILAFAFMALLGFVGIVTDVSILFVRYSTLSRATDSAAVAAATQMRRVENTSTTPGVDTGASTSIAYMSLAARQFLELYGLNPQEVTVETCQNQIANYIPDPDGPGPLAAEVDLTTDVVDASGRVIFTAADVQRRYEQICRDQRKLVRVTATIESPTVFLSMLGIPSIPLTVEAISETAVLDVVLVLDVSESMLEQTMPSDWNGTQNHLGNTLPGTVGSDEPGVVILPGRVSVLNQPDALNWWQDALTWSQAEIQNHAGLEQVLTLDGDDYQVESLAYVSGTGIVYPDRFPATNLENLPRPECRTRFWPFSPNVIYGNQVPHEVLDDYRDYILTSGEGMSEAEYFNLGALPTDPYANSDTQFRYRYWGFVPSYNFYGCCNDPNGDGSFDDLVCEPFKAARDASSRFLERVDFQRGDRVAFVTFSRQAYIVDPDGDGSLSAMIDNEDVAQDVLETAIGVRAETNFYADEAINSTGDPGSDGLWDGLVVGSRPGGAPGEIILETEPIRHDAMPLGTSYLRDTPVGSQTFFPVRNNCPFDQATLFTPFSFNAPPLLYGNQLPTWISDHLGWFDATQRSYEYRGSCRDGNVGGALRTTGAVFSDEGRREGSVWVMVLLGDGAAGASDPILDGGVAPAMSDPFREDGAGNPDPFVGDYGAFGLCPYGPSWASRGELVKNPFFPFCSDPLPETRNFCSTTDPNLQDPPNNPVHLDLQNTFNCRYVYDVDDYARDWADFVGGITESNPEQTQLPVIFTIGFGLDFQRTSYVDDGGTTITCDLTDEACMRLANPDDALGEELLRYLADIGDNFRIDDDYWQRILGEQGILPNPSDGSLTPDQRAAIYGQRGPCEDPTGAAGTYAPLPRTDNCGNYFNAPAPVQLEAAFSEIASRMFTRLAQ